jgi:hypothetical protein
MRLVATFLVALLAAFGCQAPSKDSPATAPAGDPEVGVFSPVSPGRGMHGAFEDAFAAAVTDPQDTVIIVFNDGTDAIGPDGECHPGNAPKFVRDWAETGLAGREAVVFYLCSTIVEKPTEVLGEARAEENDRLLDGLIAHGIPPGHIFLVGHSSGASAALITAGRSPDKLNAAVVAAPGYGYAYLEAEEERTADDLAILRQVNATWRAALSGFPDMTALIYLFQGDELTPPKDAIFLGDYPGVELVFVAPPGGSDELCPDGPEPHFYWWSACFREDGKQEIEAYIAERLAQTEQ